MNLDHFFGLIAPYNTYETVTFHKSTITSNRRTKSYTIYFPYHQITSP